MAAKAIPPTELLLKLLVYDPGEGALRWRPRTPDMIAAGNKSPESNCRAWNKRYAGKLAGNVSHSGYTTIMVEYRNHFAHRLIWKMIYGADPDEIDHIDGNRLNNKLDNLRDVSRLENNRNRKVRKDSSSGVIGVYWVQRKQRWAAQIRVNRRNISLGYFANIEDAGAARKAAERKYGFHPNHGREA